MKGKNQTIRCPYLCCKFALMLLLLVAPFGQVNGQSSESTGKAASDLNATDPQVNAIKAMIANKAAIKAGRAKAQICTRCHGRNGIHQLALRAGWKDSDGEFTIVKLRALRNGTASHVVMSSVASALADEDIVQIALWLNSLETKR